MSEDTPDQSDEKFEAELESLLKANGRPHGSGEKNRRPKFGRFLGQVAFGKVAKEKSKHFAGELSPYQLAVLEAQTDRIFAPEDERVEPDSVGVSIVSGVISHDGKTTVRGTAEKDVHPDGLSNQIILDVNTYKRGIRGLSDLRSSITFSFNSELNQLSVEKGSKHQLAKPSDIDMFLGSLESLTDIEPIQAELHMPYKPSMP